MDKTILIVEDDPEIFGFVRQLLEQEGFTCHGCSDGAKALQAVQQYQPQVILLDWMLPGMDGLEICTRIRQQSLAQDPFILMLTAKGEELDRVVGLSTGADDYLVKPFSSAELVARVRALLRRSLREPSSSNLYRTAHFSLDLDQHVAQRFWQGSTETLALTNLEFKLLSTFLSYPGRVWTRNQLIDALWGSDFFGEDRVVDTQVARLRKKVEPDSTVPLFIKTVTGVGYRFEDDKA